MCWSSSKTSGSGRLRSAATRNAAWLVELDLDVGLDIDAGVDAGGVGAGAGVDTTELSRLMPAVLLRRFSLSASYEQGVL
jgi:hypothetical protein